MTNGIHLVADIIKIHKLHYDEKINKMKILKTTFDPSRPKHTSVTCVTDFLTLPNIHKCELIIVHQLLNVNEYKERGYG